ncbi:hypothetical protein EV382_2473 [Micromonospora violae]|uniref:Uncharacterized protein n=1 Tax=Micromonospora violae TaxID=1278207 RepID=A0A4Q7UDM9_9ACTN|nr:hypothetical protein [Micromonospora violae]RZT79275.1 hypothetical protein EV382_2473 [Micromonospora violae]
MTATDDLSDAENWTGGFYELILILGAADDARLDRAVGALWRAAGVRGCRVGADLVEVTPGADAFPVGGHLRGALTLPGGERVVCGSYRTRYEGIDSLSLYLPLGALARVDDRIGGYPFDQRSGVESLAWRAPLDRWLADIAVAVHDDVPFARAVIGFEADEDADTTAGTSYLARLTPGDNGMVFHPATA